MCESIFYEFDLIPTVFRTENAVNSDPEVKSNKYSIGCENTMYVLFKSDLVCKIVNTWRHMHIQIIFLKFSTLQHIVYN